MDPHISCAVFTTGEPRAYLMASLPAAGMKSLGESSNTEGYDSSKIIEAFAIAEIREFGNQLSRAKVQHNSGVPATVRAQMAFLISRNLEFSIGNVTKALPATV